MLFHLIGEAGPILKFSKPVASGLVQMARLATGPDDTIYAAGSIYEDRPPATLNFVSSLIGIAFVSRLDSAGNVLWRTLLSGSRAVNQAEGLAVDSQGNAYVVGWTDSPDFPVIRAFQSRFPTRPNQSSGFLTKLDPQGRVVFSTFLGGTGLNQAFDVAVDSAGGAVVVGLTDAEDFPTTPGVVMPQARQPNPFARSSYAFITRFTPAGDRPVYSTYLGGPSTVCTCGGSCCVPVVGQTWATAVAVDSVGSVYVAGATGATDFPVTVSAPRYGGFVSKLNSSGSRLLYSTYSPGSVRAAIALDSLGRVTIAGSANGGGLPASPDAIQRGFLGCTEGRPLCAVPNGYVFQLDPTGASPVYSTYVGGKSADIKGMAVDAQGNVWLSGSRAGPDFPLTAGAFGRGGDFVMQLNSSGTAILRSTQLPESLSGGHIIRSSSGRTYIAGASSGLVSQIDFQDAASPVILGISSGAGGPLLGTLSPGEIISVHGIDIGAVEPVGARLDADGRVDTELGGARLFFQGIAAPLLYAQADQINAIVPYGIAGNPEVLIDVVRDGSVTASRVVKLVEAQPRLFPGATLNENGSVNTERSRAVSGSIVSLFATGFGDLVPRPADGEIIVGSLPQLKLPVTVFVRDRSAEVAYAGSAPGFVAGAIQVNFRIPEQLSGCASWIPILLRVGNRAPPLRSILWVACS